MVKTGKKVPKIAFLGLERVVAYKAFNRNLGMARITHFFEVTKVKPYLLPKKRREESYIRYSSKSLYYKGFRKLYNKIIN